MRCHFLNLFSNIASAVDSFFYVVVITVATITHYSLSVYGIVGMRSTYIYNAHHKNANRRTVSSLSSLSNGSTTRLDSNAVVVSAVLVQHKHSGIPRFDISRCHHGM